MALMRWDPFGEVSRMQRDMDRIFSRMGTTEPAAESIAWMPRINVRQSGEDLDVRVELAGIQPQDVEIEVTDGVLSITGRRKAESEREDEGWMIRESSFGSFERSIALPEGVDPASIHADFRDGMLEITVPRALQATQSKTTRIAIGEPSTGAKPIQEAQAPMAPPSEHVTDQPGMHAHH